MNSSTSLHVNTPNYRLGPWWLQPNLLECSVCSPKQPHKSYCTGFALLQIKTQTNVQKCNCWCSQPSAVHGSPLLIFVSYTVSQQMHLSASLLELKVLERRLFTVLSWWLWVFGEPGINWTQFSFLWEELKDYRSLGAYLDDWLDWRSKTEALFVATFYWGSSVRACASKKPTKWLRREALRWSSWEGKRECCMLWC